MPYSRPGLTQLNDQAIQDITTSGVPGLDGLLRNAVLRVLAWVLSGLTYGLYGYLDWIARQATPFTSTDEYLRAWGNLIGVYAKDATAASGVAQFTGNSGVVLRAGASLTMLGGIAYTTTADGTIDGTGSMQVPITASDVGAFTNAAANTPINIGSPPAGINAAGYTVGPLTGGSNQETEAEFRTRMLAKYAEPPQGGSVADYQTWCLAIPGVTRVWVAPNAMGTGSVVLYPMFDDANAAFDGFPQGTDGTASEEHRGTGPATGDQLTVAEAVWPKQPVTALVYVCAATPYPIDIELTELEPHTAELEDQIIAALNDAFLQVSEVGGVVYPSALYEAILATPGVTHFTMLSPAVGVDVPAGNLPVMGNLIVS